MNLGAVRDAAGNVTELLASINLDADAIAPVTTVSGADALLAQQAGDAELHGR